MNLMKLLKAEPVATTSIISAAIGLATILGAPEKVMGALGILLGALLAFPVRGTVTTVAKTVEVVAQASAMAAESTAAQLTPETVGALGSVPAPEVVEDAARMATTVALTGLGLSRREAKAATA